MQVLQLSAVLWRQSAREAASDLLLLEPGLQKPRALKTIAAFKQSSAIYSFIANQLLAYDVADSPDR